MKRFSFILSLVLILALTSVTAFAQTDEIIVTIDSVKVEFNEKVGFPFVDENYRTLVPFRKCLETYGATVDWDNESRTAIAIKEDVKVEVPIDKNYIIINGEQKQIDTAAKILNDKTYLPIRPVIEAFGSSVEWDPGFKTVVITREPVDAKAIFLEANNKSYEWKNYDADILVNMSIPFKDETGKVENMNMDMKMYATMFMKPTIKMKLNASMIINAMGQEMTQPIMEMYMLFDDKSFATYSGVADETGTLNWTKTIVEDEMFADLIKYDDEYIKENKELTEKYTKDVKYFGKYNIEDNTLLRLQYTMSGEIFKEVLGTYIDEMSKSASEDDLMVVEMLKSFYDGTFGDLTYIVYVDESTSEIVRYEIDLGNIISSMMTKMSDMMGEIPEEDMEMLKQMKATMIMDVLNINEAKDFEIPEEALNAPDAEEILNELEETQVIE